MSKEINPCDVSYDTLDEPENLDHHIGQQLKKKRLALGLSQESLAESVGVTFQQIQKYERGRNRIAASRLFQLATALNVPLSYFFDQLPLYLAEDQLAYEGSTPDRLTQELITEFQHIKNPALRQKLLELARALAGHDESDNQE